MEVSYFGPNGRELRLLDGRSEWNRALAYAGISGLVGSAEAVVQKGVGAPGQKPTSYVIKPMTGELVLHITDDGTVPVDELVAELRREFRANRHGTLMVRRGMFTDRYRTKVRLNGFIEPPISDYRSEGYAEIRVPLIADSGVWDAPELRRTGQLTAGETVSIDNPGDTYIWPRVEWFGGYALFKHEDATAWTTLPDSGSRFTTISCDPSTGHEARTPDGSIDTAMSELTKRLRISFGVSAGHSEKFVISHNVSLIWTPQFLDPWR